MILLHAKKLDPSCLLVGDMLRIHLYQLGEIYEYVMIIYYPMIMFHDQLLIMIKSSAMMLRWHSQSQCRSVLTDIQSKDTSHPSPATYKSQYFPVNWMVCHTSVTPTPSVSQCHEHFQRWIARFVRGWEVAVWKSQTQFTDTAMF